jgi:hypothetical protein
MNVKLGMPLENGIPLNLPDLADVGVIDDFFGLRITVVVLAEIPNNVGILSLQGVLVILGVIYTSQG